MCALLPCQLFDRALTDSSNSLVANQNLLTKVYFPRLVIPLSAVLSGLADFIIAFAVFLVMMLYYGIFPTRAFLSLPFFILLAGGAALSVGLWLSALNVQYRDVRHTIPFIAQLWFFLTPVVYPSSLVPESWWLIYGLNPMVGVVEGFRWALLGKPGRPGLMLLVSVVVMTVLLISGLHYFRRTEKGFADVV